MPTLYDEMRIEEERRQSHMREAFNESCKSLPGFSPEPRVTLFSGSMKTNRSCSYCNTPVLKGKLFCYGCGKRIEWKCQCCGDMVQADYKFCPGCGVEIDAPVKRG